MLRLDFVQRTLRTEVIGARPEAFMSVSTDSRTESDRALFFALTGPTFNGHDFIAAAMDHGATGAVIEKGHVERAKVMLGRRLQKFMLVPVADTLRALGDLAAAYRRSLAVKIAGVTGSNGKTTSKECIAAILGTMGSVLKTSGNLNNLIGLPLTVFKIAESHKFAVLEMGMNQPGEIGRLSSIALPDVALITNVHPAHLEGLGSVEAIAGEKWQIFEGLREDGIAVINLDDPSLKARAAGLKLKKLTFGSSPGCDVRLLEARSLGLDGQELLLEISGTRSTARIPHLGRHNALNATAAAAVGTAFGAGPGQISEGLASVQIVSRRLEHELVGGVHVLNDAYNANPKSMEGALETLSSMAAGLQTFAVLGDMLEMGPGSAELHYELGRAVARLGISFLIVLGAESTSTVSGAVDAGMDPSACFKAMDAFDASWIMRKRARPGGWVLIKGSRGMRMEVVLEHFRQSFAGGQA
jgi:UDP-N-acetylmuramoyl-tripeptide--D-alanyl-D-alanine ligase